MTRTWSARLGEAFGVKLCAELVDWYDNERWRQPYGGGFFEFISPEELIDEQSAAVWGGQMLPDSLPLADNGGGDVLAMRFGEKSTCEEIVRWSHGAGQWSPWGATLAEALFFDFLTKHESAEDQESPLEEPVFDWTLERLFQEEAARERMRALVDSGEIAGLETQLARGLCRIPLLEREVRRCCDAAQGIPVEWKRAADVAGQVAAIRTDLAWPFAVLGREAELRGDGATAAKRFIEEMCALGTTAGFTEAWQEPPNPHAARFERYASQISDARERERIAAKVRQETREYWTSLARWAEAQGDVVHGYEYWFLAGWDEFFTNDMDKILESLARCADQAGYDARARIARRHARGL